MIILKVIGLIFFLIIMPSIVGLVPQYYLKRKSNFEDILIYGYLFMLSILELVGIPIVVLTNEGGYRLFLMLFSLVLFAVGIWGIVLNRRYLKKYFRSNPIKKKVEAFLDDSLETKIYFGLIVIVVLLQLVMIFVFASMDADDFYYNAQALTAQQFGTMYRIDANTGRSTQLDIRHAMALFPMWQAYVSSMTGIHVAILAHKVIPLILIPLSYFLVYRISQILFPSKKELQMIFTFLMNIWRIFGFVSYFTTETFFLLRTWQGKSFAGNFIFPAILWIFLKIYGRKTKTKNTTKWYLLLSLAILASGSSSSLAVMLSCILTGILGLIFLIRTGNIRAFIYQLLSCLPGMVYVAIYIIA